MSLLRQRSGLALVFLLGLPVEARPDAETVRVDLVSETVARRLPFDVPFVLEGDAPPGTSRVEMQLQSKTRAEAFAELSAGPAAVSGTDSAGRFRLQVPAIPADRDVRFDLRPRAQPHGERAAPVPAGRRGAPAARDGSRP